MPQICDMGPTALLPLRRKACWGFFSPLKIRRLRPGLNPRTWVPKASTLPLDHRSRFTSTYNLKKILTKHFPLWTLIPPPGDFKIYISSSPSCNRHRNFNRYHVQTGADLPWSWWSLSFRAPHLHGAFPRPWRGGPSNVFTRSLCFCKIYRRKTF